MIFEWNRREKLERIRDYSLTKRLRYNFLLFPNSDIDRNKKEFILER